MASPRFQFRLWTIFAITALVGWAIVALPYWVHTYPEDQIRLMGLSERERDEELYNRHNDEPMTRYDFFAKPLMVGIASVTALTVGLAVFRHARHRKAQ